MKIALLSLGMAWAAYFVGQDSIPAPLADSVVVADSGLDTALFDHELNWLEWLRKRLHE